jgi:hypothetical protein
LFRTPCDEENNGRGQRREAHHTTAGHHRRGAAEIGTSQATSLNWRVGTGKHHPTITLDRTESGEAKRGS